MNPPNQLKHFAFGVGVRGALLAPDDHAKVCQIPDANLFQHLFQRRHRRLLSSSLAAVGNSICRLYRTPLTPVAETTQRWTRRTVTTG